MRNLLEYPITQDEKIKVLKDLIAEQEFALIEDTVETGSKTNIAFKEILEEITNVKYYPAVTKGEKITLLQEVIEAETALMLEGMVGIGNPIISILQEILKDVNRMKDD